MQNRLTQLTASTYSVYFKRYYLRVACSGSLEQRQTRHFHSSALYSWDHRYITGISQYHHFVLNLTPAAAAGSDLGLSLAPLFSPSHQSIDTESNVKIGERALIMGGPTLATNLLSTGLIAWKAWYTPLVSDLQGPFLTHFACVGIVASQ